LVQRHSATTFTSSRCLHSSGLPSASERYCMIFFSRYYLLTSVWLSLVAKKKKKKKKASSRYMNYRIWSYIHGQMQRTTMKMSSKHICLFNL
jgi:hypothetical protein